MTENVVVDDDAVLFAWARQLTRYMIRVSPGILGYHSYDDLLSDAMLGAVKARRDFQEGHGTTRQSYAWTRMKGEVIDGLRRRSQWTRAEVASGETGRRIYSIAVLAEYGWDPAESEGGYDQIEDALTVRRLLPLLPSREREVVTRTYLDGERLRDVANSWGVTEGRASQIRTAAMMTLRQFYRAEAA